MSSAESSWKGTLRFFFDSFLTQLQCKEEKEVVKNRRFWCSEAVFETYKHTDLFSYALDVNYLEIQGSSHWSFGLFHLCQLSVTLLLPRLLESVPFPYLQVFLYLPRLAVSLLFLFYRYLFSNAPSSIRYLRCRQNVALYQRFQLWLRHFQKYQWIRM